MASPHVAGLIAALLTNHRLKGDKAVRQALTTKYALDIAADGLDNATGLGFVTYLKAAEFDALLPRGKKASTSSKGQKNSSHLTQARVN